MATNKRKRHEFSKLILLVFGLVELFVVVFTCRMVYTTKDLTPLAYLIPSTAVFGATAVKNYYSKAKVENRIKLMRKYGVQPTAEAFNDNNY